MAKKGTHKFGAISIRIEPNFDGSEVLWKVHIAQGGIYGVQTSGFASGPADAAKKASEFVEASMRANNAGLTRPTLAVDNTAPAQKGGE